MKISSKKASVLSFLFLSILPIAGSIRLMATTPQPEEVLNAIYKVNDYWQTTNPNHGRAFWDRATYHTGNMAVYDITKDPVYLDYSLGFANYNNWKGAASDNKTKWKYSYGETSEYVLFGDWQTCFQVYADLYNAQPDETKIARALDVMEYQMSTPNIDYWWWVDGLYMVMPVMTRLYKITNNPLYLEKLHQYWQYANSIMYDTETGLYFRDKNYVYPAHQTNSGKKDFWARGNGWVFAAFARVLADLPKTDQYRDTYIQYFNRMAEKLAEAQQNEGYWTRSVLDPEYVPGYETSGTAFFAYGFLWGINNGYLSDEKYGQTARKAWQYLASIALQESGKVGYVQPIGASAVPGQVISINSTADFGVGAFLLAATEMYKYTGGNTSLNKLRLYKAQAINDNTVQLEFNAPLNALSAQNSNNYLLNGKTIAGSVNYNNDKTVTLTLAQPLMYGSNTIEVRNIKSKDEVAINSGSSKEFFVAVPLTPNDNNNIAVTAIGSQTGNTPDKTLDNDINSRWSQEGIGQWIKYDLGETKQVNAVDIAFFSGNQRLNYFSIELSNDDTNYYPALSDVVSSGTTNELERYAFTTRPARYVKIICNGNSASNWNSISETRIRFTEINAGLNPDSNIRKNHFYYRNPIKKNEEIRLIPCSEDLSAYLAEVIDLKGNTIISKKINSTPILIGRIKTPGLYILKLTNSLNQSTSLKLIQE